MAPVASLISSERAVSCFLNLSIRSGDHRAICKIVFLKLDVTFQEVFSILLIGKPSKNGYFLLCSLLQAVIWEAPPRSSLLPDSLCPWPLRLHPSSHCALLHLQDSPQLLPGSVFFESRDSFEFKQVRHLHGVPILLVLSKEPVLSVQKPYTVCLGCNLKQIYQEFPQTRCAWHVSGLMIDLRP